MSVSLDEVSVFKDCAGQDLERLASVCEKITIKGGDRIFEAGRAAEYLYIVAEGCVELRFNVIHYNDVSQITLDRKCKGEAFGWSALTEPHEYTLSAFAAKDSELLRIKGTDIERLCRESQNLGYAVMKNIAHIIGQRFALIQKILIDVIQQSLNAKER